MRFDSEYFSKYQQYVPGFLQAAIIGLLYRFRSIVYRGDRVYCNCCDASYECYLSPYLECPGCGSQARQRLMLYYLQSKTDLFSRPHRLLHFAPESCLEAHFCNAANIKYLSADLDSPRAMERVDMTNMPFSKQSFTAILCSHVLEHVPQDAKAMKELHRVLAADGWALLQVPIDQYRKTTYENFSITTPQGREKHFGRFDHCRVYGLDYKARLEQAGFDVTVDDFVKTFAASDIEKYGLEDWENVYFCRKRTG